MNYHEYSWFMLFALWRVVETEFALIVQEDGCVLSTDNRHDDYLQYDYLGAPIHLAHVDEPDGPHWLKQFEWVQRHGSAGLYRHAGAQWRLQPAQSALDARAG